MHSPTHQSLFGGRTTVPGSGGQPNRSPYLARHESVPHKTTAEKGSTNVGALVRKVKIASASSKRKPKSTTPATAIRFMVSISAVQTRLFSRMVFPCPVF